MIARKPLHRAVRIVISDQIRPFIVRSYISEEINEYFDLLFRISVIYICFHMRQLTNDLEHNGRKRLLLARLSFNPKTLKQELQDSKTYSIVRRKIGSLMIFKLQIHVSGSFSLAIQSFYRSKFSPNPFAGPINQIIFQSCRPHWLQST